MGINLSKYRLFTLFGFFWLGLAWLGTVLALFGFFYAWILAIYAILAGFGLAYLSLTNRMNFKLSWKFFSIFLLSAAATALFSYYTTPTIFSGRDQGSFSEAAIRLSQNHQIKFSTPASEEFFKIYGPGKALNFPGFVYAKDGQLTTQFSLGYVSWLAIFYSFFGLYGLVIANAVSFLIFLLSFYLLARLYLKTSSAVTAYLLLLTSFAFSWFFKFTLSENLALALTWFGIVELVLFIKREKRFYLWASLLALFLLALTRLEALAFIAALFLVLLVKYRSPRLVLFEIMGKNMLLVILGIILVYIFNIYANIAFYASSLSGLINSSSFLNDSVSNPAAPFASFEYIVRILSAYAIIYFLVLGFGGFALCIGRKRFDALVPYLILLPSFIFLFHPGISSDHPWILRRFVFAIIPVSLLYTVLFLNCLFKKRYFFNGISLLLIAINLLVFMPYLKFSENNTLLDQIEDLSHNFQSSDLVLIDRLATGDGWAMMTGPLSFLYGKQAVYFFNPSDLDKLDLKKFNQVYFIIPNDRLDLYTRSGIFERLVAQKDFKIKTTSLNIISGSKKELYGSPIILPASGERITYGKVYLLK